MYCWVGRGQGGRAPLGGAGARGGNKNKWLAFDRIVSRIRVLNQLAPRDEDGAFKGCLVTQATT